VLPVPGRQQRGCRVEVVRRKCANLKPTHGATIALRDPIYSLSMTRLRVPRAGIASALVAVLVVLTLTSSSHASGPGRRLLVVATAAPSYVEVAHVYDTQGRLLSTVLGARGDQFTWSPNGRLLAVTSAGGLLVERPDGSGRHRLITSRTSCTDRCASAATVAWAPSSERLAVGGTDPKTTGFDLLDVSTGHLMPLRSPRPNSNYVPIAFSPDGRQLAYAFYGGNAGTGSCCVSELVVAAANGRSPHVLHRFGDPIHDGPGVATWSPDSTRIAFTDDGRDPKDPRLAIVDVQSGRLRALAPRNVYDQSPAWSPQGTRLALTQFKGPAFTIAADGSQFHSLGIIGTTALWLRDGDLLVSSGKANRTVALIRGGTGRAHTLFALPDGEQVVSIREAG
jgi:YD repeat-containing protein